jgi:hypothetical protein
LVEAVTKTRIKKSDISIQNLIRCAKALESVASKGFHLEIEAVWQWAAELIDERQRRVSIV